VAEPAIATGASLTGSTMKCTVPTPLEAPTLAV
jgi:hypothetical protein